MPWLSISIRVKPKKPSPLVSHTLTYYSSHSLNSNHTFLLAVLQTYQVHLSLNCSFCLQHFSLRKWPLTRNNFSPTGHLACLETFLIVLTQERGGTTVNQWVEAQDTAKYLTMHRVGPTTKKIIHPKMSVVLRLRNPSLRSQSMPDSLTFFMSLFMCHLLNEAYPDQPTLIYNSLLPHVHQLFLTLVYFSFYISLNILPNLLSYACLLFFFPGQNLSSMKAEMFVLFPDIAHVPGLLQAFGIFTMLMNKLIWTLMLNTETFQST